MDHMDHMDISVLQNTGTNGGSTRVPGSEKTAFYKVLPRPLWRLKQMFLARFELVVTRFGTPQVRKCFQNGPFWDQRWVKNGQKRVFPTVIRDHFGSTNK